MAPVELELNVGGAQHILPFDMLARLKIVLFTGAATRTGVSRQRRTVHKLDFAIGRFYSGKDSAVQPFPALLWVLPAHPLAYGDAETVKVRIFVDDLGNSFACILFDDLAGIAIPARQGGRRRIEGHVMRKCKAGRNKDIPIDNISFDPPVVRHCEETGPELLHGRQFHIVKRTSFGKMLHPYHVVERVHTPQRENVEAIGGHHVQELLPEFKVEHHIFLLGKRQSRPVPNDRQIELDSPET